MYFCGWDGGASSTKACVLSPRGEETEAFEMGPLNPNGAAKETVRQSVADGVARMRQLPEGLEGCGGLVIGIAGVSNESAAQLVRDAVRACGYLGPLRLMGDQEIALAGAIDGPGAILIAGTGSVCFGRDGEGRPFRTGGFGYLIDDGGSGYAVGRDILSAAVRASDGRGEKTALTELVFSKLGISGIPGLVTWLYSPGTGKREVASLAPLLLQAIRMNDHTACQIALRAGDDLAELVLCAWKTAGMTGGELALFGSILTYYPEIRSRLLDRLQSSLPSLTIVAPRRTAARGAADLARAQFS